MTPRAAIVALNCITAVCARPFRQTAGVQGRAKDYLAWCAERDLDPHRFMLAKHEAVGRRFRIGFKRLMQASPSFIAKFREWGDSRQAEHVGQQRITERTVTEAVGVLETTILGESVKSRWVTNPLFCMASPETGGWNPRSDYCACCPLAVDCRSNLHPKTLEARDAGC